MQRSSIAVIGSGISGMATAHYLAAHHDVTLFETEPRLGGHTATVDVEVQGRQYAVDTGFIVYNDWTYPHFIALMDSLGVQSQPTDMSFSVSCQRTGVEYCGSDLNGLFAQRSNLFSPRFLKMLADIVRFNRESVEELNAGRLDAQLTLGDYLAARGYSQRFIEHYIVPMGSAIWSCGLDAMLQFPLAFFVRFFRNHGLLNIANRPQWRTLVGGSRQYIAPLTAALAGRIRLGEGVHAVRRLEDRVEIHTQKGERVSVDQVVIATHSDQALALLDDASEPEREVLSGMPYQMNHVVLHTDTRLLPERKKAWASWNYLLRGGQEKTHPVVTYHMNRLQCISAPVEFCVTLNAGPVIREEHILGEFHYSHPLYSLDSVRAQARWSEINGVRRTWFCGAYWGNGFHEDGVVSARRVAQALGCLA